MAKELYVGHISEQATEEDLRKLFEVMGVVTSVHLIVDQETGEFKRCGYVRMLSAVDLKEVVETLDGAWLIDRCIVVSIAKPQKDRPVKTPFVRRTHPAGGRPPATGEAAASRRPAGEKSMSRSRPAATEAGKSGRSSSAKEVVRKDRHVAAKDAAKSERPASAAKRPGRPVGGKKQGDGPRTPSKGRR